MNRDMPENPFAFPSPDDGRPSDGYGMDLLDWFAGQVIGTVVREMQANRIGDHPDAGGGPAGFAASAYDIAKAMLTERAKSRGEA